MFATSTRTAITLLLAIVATLTVALPAQADEHHASVSVPVESEDSTYVVQVNAGAGTWQIRRSARQLNAQLAEAVPQLQVRTSGDCATADVCVTVQAARYSTDDMLRVSGGAFHAWSGFITYPTPSTREIYLNERTTVGARDRAEVARHELGHALGLGHHYGPGIMGDYVNPGPLLSASEIEVLRSLYAS